MRRNYKFFKVKTTPVAPPETLKPITEFQLDDTVDWHKAVFHRQQILVLGQRDGRLLLARFNCIDRVEYYDLGDYIKTTSWVFAPENTQGILIYLPAEYPIPSFHLEENADFPMGATLHFVHWLPKLTFGLALCEEDKVAVVYSQETLLPDSWWRKSYPITLGFFTPSGALISNMELRPIGSFRPLQMQNPMRHGTKMVSKNGFLYLSEEHGMIIVNMQTGYCGQPSFLFNYADVAIGSCLPNHLVIVPRVSEADGSIYFNRLYTSRRELETDYFAPPRLKPNRLRPKQMENLHAAGFVKKRFFAVFDELALFYGNIQSDLEPEIVLEITFQENVQDGIVLGEKNNRCAFLTHGKKLLIYQIRF